MPNILLSHRRAVLQGIAGACVLAGLSARSSAAQAADKVVHIGTQKGVTLYILRDRDTLQKALKPFGYHVTFTEFPGGPQLLEALNVGAIDFGTTGEAPPIFAQAAGAPLAYVAYQPGAPKGEAILVPEVSPIHNLAELKGKRIALNKGSNVHFLLVQALRHAGLSYGDIQPQYLQPADARAAFEAGSVDAWVIWDPYLAAAQDATHARVLTDATGLAPNREFLLASRALVDAAPQVVSTILSALNTADLWAASHIPEAAAELAPGMGLPPRIVEIALHHTGFGVHRMTPEVVADQQKIADTFYELKLIPHHLNVATSVWTTQS